jgi:serine protease Do
MSMMATVKRISKVTAESLGARALLLLGALLLLSPAARADSEERRIKAIERARPAVVSIRTYHEEGAEPGIGSGVIVRSDGYILTNFHVIDGANVVRVTLTDKREFTAQVLHLAPQHDLAILKVRAKNLPTAVIGSSRAVKLGQSAIAIGDPLGFTSSVTIGTVGGKDRTVEAGGVTYKSLIQTDAAINPGSSGGALVDLEGRVIGINTLVYTGPRSYQHAQGLGFAISIDHAMAVVKALMARKGENVSNRPWLGIKGDTVTRDIAESYGLKANKGVFIRGITPGSPAQAGGFRNGDVILKVDGVQVLGLSDLSTQLNKRRAGDKVKFDILRKGKMASLSVTLDVSSH